MVVVVVLVAIGSLPVLACASYLFFLALLSGRRAGASAVSPSTKFDFIVPAHNEEHGIADTVQSLLAVEYPAALRRVLVVADNCEDATAACAEKAGATVLVRRDARLRGKGYALKFAFDRSLADGFADAVVVVDADTVASQNLLSAAAARLAAGAKAMQVEYSVRNPSASWRTRLMVIALATFHRVRSLGRARLGLSCGLRGNGMVFSREVLERVPHEAFSLVEDLEYGIRLAKAGYPVEYIDEARVLGEMVSSEKASRSQRLRWEEGRQAMRREYGWPLVREAVERRDKVLLDLAMDVLVPPLSYVFGAALVGTALAVALAAAGPPHASLALWPWAVALAMTTTYVLRGVALSGVGARGLLDLAWAPVYICWKVALMAAMRARRTGDEWVRTAREERKP